MFDTDVINGCRVAYIEPKSLVHQVLSFIAAQKIMAILCSDEEPKKKVYRPGIEEDPNYINAKEISLEFNLNPTGLQWMVSSNIIFQQISMKALSKFNNELYVTLTLYGEEILNDLEKGQEVELYLD